MRALYWWIDRWRGSTAFTEMSLTEQGAYRNLLDEAWKRDGPIPDDADLIAKASGDPAQWRKMRDHVMRWFDLRDGQWHNATLEEILQVSQRRAAKQAAYRNRTVDRPLRRKGHV